MATFATLIHKYGQIFAIEPAIDTPVIGKSFAKLTFGEWRRQRQRQMRCKPWQPAPIFFNLIGGPMDSG